MIRSTARTIALSAGVFPSLTAGLLAAPLLWPMKSPGSVLDYSLDLTAPLADIADTIASASVSVAPSGELAIGSVSVLGNVVTVDVSGGIPGRSYTVRLDVTTAGGDVLEYMVSLLVNPALATFPLSAAASPGFGQAIVWTATGITVGIYGLTIYGESVYA